ncbi:response regulator transcription factor [Metabacillus fastidiosus]|uniref:response regulator transcription factor n=1 Tax=Metabacillus fastidiosus TaxID=1458 RepID=UPI003D29FA73
MKGLLSDREREVAVLVAEGLKDIEISKELFISRRRVGEIISSIKRKLNITSRVQIGIAAYSLGLITFQLDFQLEHNFG